MMRCAEEFLTALLQLATMFTLAHTSGATCLEEQVNSCRQAASERRLGTLSGGGECKPSAYVHYTHECRVNDYLPSVDFCCCLLEQRVLCCRYHQDWDRFRCAESDDTIHQLPSGNLLPLKVLLPAVLGPLLLLACCLFCCVKCLCHKYYDEEERDCSCCCCASRDEDACSSPAPSKKKPRAPSPDEFVPLTYPNLLQQPESDGSQSKLLHLTSCSSSSSEPRPQPSAPPLLLDPVGGGGNNDVFVHPTDFTGYGVVGGNNNPSSQQQHPLCPSCSSAVLPPPPTYEESQDHPSPPH